MEKKGGRNEGGRAEEKGCWRGRREEGEGLKKNEGVKEKNRM